MKKTIINSCIIFLICCITHFTYDIFPNGFTLIFSPVNESIFEHFKMLYAAGFIFSLFTLYKNTNQNFFLKAYLRSILSILILAIIYLPINYFVGEILPLTLILLFISIFITEIIISKIPQKKHYKILNIISACLIVINFLVFIYLSYKPLHYNIFYDNKNHLYGIK